MAGKIGRLAVSMKWSVVLELFPHVFVRVPKYMHLPTALGIVLVVRMCFRESPQGRRGGVANAGLLRIAGAPSET